MSDAGLLGAQLYGRLAELLAPPGSLDGRTSLVLVEPCGRDLDPADFATDPDVEGAEAFADLVNAVPVPGGTFVDSSRRLDDVAELVLLNAATDSGASIAAATLVERARTDLELMARGSLTMGDLYHPAQADPEHWWNDSTPWATVSFTIGSTAPPPTPPLEVLPITAPPLFWTTCPEFDTTTDPGISLAASGGLSLSRLATDPDLRSRVGTGLANRRSVPITAETPDPRVLRVDQPVRRFGAVRPALAPGTGALLESPPVAEGPAAGTRVGPRLFPDRIAARGGFEIGEVVDPGPVPERRLRYRDLLAAHGDLVEAAPTAPAQPAASGFDLSFAYRVVGIDRPWWHPELFSQPGWTMPGFAPGAVSTGTATGNPGLLGAVTTRMLLVRDLTIRGSWSPTDASAAAAAQQQFGTLGLGPFSLTGEVGWDGSSLTRPGTQVVAWLAALTPQFPLPA